jgi:hypothetical protein
LRIVGGRYTVRSVLSGAGIGTGHSRGASYGPATSFIDNLEIIGGHFTATGHHSGAIGAGSAAASSLSGIGNLSISGGDFDLFSTNGPGIGTGFAEQAQSTIDRITISGGTFKISGDYDRLAYNGDPNWVKWAGSSGIGTGFADGPSAQGGSSVFGSARIESILISGGSYDIASTTGAAIGAGL